MVITHMSKPMTMRIWRCWIVTFLSGLLLSVSVPTVSAWAAQPMPSPEGQAFLDPEQAFVFQARLKDAKTIEAQWDIADGVTMCGDKIALSLVGEGVSLGAFTLPQGQEKTDEFSGVQQVYHGRVTVLLPLERKGAEKSTAELTAVFQGCADGGVCYPPITKKIKLELPPLAVEMAVATDVSAEATEKTVSEQDQLAGTLAGGNTLLTLVTFFGLGLLLSLTPCIFPMIPILSGIIIGHGKNITTGRAFSLSLIYVLAMSVAYTLAGVLAGLFGANLQAAFQNPWSLGLFALVFVLLALSMFGLYDLQLPASWQTRMDRISRSQHGSKIAGVAVMGFFSAIIVGPCVAPPLMGALIYIGKTGDAILGGAALFSLSLGMGAPLLIVGTTAGKFIPKAGGWLNSVKAIFGVLLLAVAIWLLDRVLPGRLTMFLWAALMVFSGIYLGALDHLTSESPGWKRFWKGFGLLILVYGLLLFIGAMGKSAQAPFFVWMHPAMEAPSPVSAFVHGAAMPAAGIYMIARLYPLYTLSPDIMQVMTWTGAVTAFMGAAIALVSFDIKRVIAFSAVSQLGCILLALGAGGLNAGIFHLIISGYLTALLFLAAGAVIHYAGTNDIRKLGGLRQKIPTAWWTFLFAALAVSGIPPFSGFFSKTETLKTALAQGYSLYIPALITSAFTSLYMARVFITTFHARSKNTAGYSTAAETPHTMAFPIIFLAMLSLVLGWTLSHNGLLNYYIDSGLQAPLRLTEYLKTAVSISVSAAFMGIGVYLYQIRPDIPEILREKMRTLRRIIESSFGFDAFFLKLAYISGRTAQILYKIDFEFFDRIFIDGWALIADRLSRFSAWLDDNAADKAVEALGTAVFALGKTARFAQTGFAQNYLLVIAIAVSLFAAAAFSM